uniref:Uncharacterized protein n=1 Tax=Avena sativa TaxID=4498 RepID=A0ACD6AFX8_AVESA
MFAMSNENMDDIYVFLMNCCGPRLERLFVQLPTRGYQCEPEKSEKELSGSESDENGLVEELLQGEPPEVAELDEELSEELSEGEAPEEDGLHEDLSEGETPEVDELEDELSEGEAQEEDELEKDLSEGEVPEEDQTEAFENLMLLKMINLRGYDNEMRLVRLVLKKSTRLEQLILFTPKSNHRKGLKKDHMNTSDFIERKLLPLRMASPNAEIILGEPDDSAIQPLHDFYQG